MQDKISAAKHKNLWLWIGIICAIAICVSFFYFYSSTRVPPEVEHFYSNYMKTIKSDYAKAVNEYCYFEDPVIKELIAQSTDYVTEYRILKWNQLSDQLWVVKTFFKTVYMPEGDTMYNFVGNIDGIYYVILNSYLVPPQLQGNLDLSIYLPPNVVPYEDVVGLHG